MGTLPPSAEEDENSAKLKPRPVHQGKSYNKERAGVAATKSSDRVGLASSSLENSRDQMAARPPSSGLAGGKSHHEAAG